MVTLVTLNQIANLRRCVRNIPRHARYFGNYGNLGNYLDFTPF